MTTKEKIFDIIGGTFLYAVFLGVCAFLLLYIIIFAFSVAVLALACISNLF